MIITKDGVEILNLSDTRKKVIMNDINADVFDEDMMRRLQYIIEHKYEQCFRRLKAEWEPKLAAAGIESIPLNQDAFAELVFSQPTYKDRKTRESESQSDLGG